MLSNHLFFGLPLARWPWRSISMEKYMRVCVEKTVLSPHESHHRSMSICVWRVCIMSTTRSSFSMSTFCLRSLLESPHIFLSTVISKTLNFLLCSSSQSYTEGMTGPRSDRGALLMSCSSPLTSTLYEDSSQCLLLVLFFSLYLCHRTHLEKWLHSPPR